MINTFSANEIPNRGGSDQQAFSDAMDAFIKKLTTLTIPQINAFADALNNYSLSATSTSNVTIGTGIQNFVVNINKSFLPGMQLTIADAAAPADNLMLGNVISYVAGTGALSVKVKKYIGSGTKANWVISSAANASFEQSRGSLVMHATTMDLWSQPEVIDGTGAGVTMTNIAAAPQPGATRTLYPVAGTVITHGSIFDVEGNANYTFATGDACIITAITTTTFKVNLIKDDGTPASLPIIVPPGTRISFTGITAPAGYLICPTAPTTVSRTTYAALFAAIGTTWGAGDGSTTFNIPWYPADYAPVQANGNVGSQTAGQMPAHTHLSNAVGLLNPTINWSGTGGVSYNNSNSTQTGSAGSGTNNLAAGVRELFCVKF